MHLSLRCLPVFALALTAACRTPRSPAREAQYVLVYLKSGERAAERSKQEREEIQRGHMANIGRLADAGHLIIAGPYGEPRRSQTFRGIFIFDAASIGEARALTATDPAVQAGVLAMELYPLRASASWRDVPKLDEALNAEVARSGKKPSFEDVMRSYAILETQDEARVREALGDRRVILAATFEGDRAGTTLLVVEATNAAALASELERVDSALRTITFCEGWWASRALERLPSSAGR